MLRAQNDSARPKHTEGSLCDLNMCTTPQRDQFDPPKQSAQRFALRSQNAHRATARATRPAQSAQRVQFAISKCEPRHSERFDTPKARSEVRFACLRRTPPQPERFDLPKARRRFTLRAENAHRATARATRPNESAAPATKSARKLESAAPATKSARKALKCCAFHEICTKSSKVLRLSRKIASQRHAKGSKCCACHENRARDCSARMISIRQQRKRRRRKHYHAPAKDTSKRPPLDRKFHWHGNENTQPSKTLRLRSETTRRA